MKIVFCTEQIVGSGGVERVLSQRLNYFVNIFKYDIIIVTTESNTKFKDSFFYFNPKIKIINLTIDCSNVLEKKFLRRQLQIRKKNKKKLEELNQIINKIKPDILVSVSGGQSDICLKITYKCKKILEHHVNKESFIGKINGGICYNTIKSLYKTCREYYFLKKYDEFLVLTNEDKLAWNSDKIKVINNPLPFISNKVSDCQNKKIISVGRLEKQKGFDMLIDTWEKVNKLYPDWILEIYGEGSLRKELQNKIDSLGLTNSLLLKGNEKNIQEKYLNSSIYVMSSRYEGMPMVLLEAMNCGLPIVSFECPCGPKDLIEDGKNGYLCKCFDIDEMAKKIISLIKNKEKRIEMGKKSRELSFNYSEDKIMNQWKELFENLLKK